MSEELKRSAGYALRLFNEKADKLESSEFTKVILSEPFGFRIELDNKQGVGAAWRTGPQGESIDAFVGTFRQFLQKNDLISFRNMARYYDRLRAAGLIAENLASDFGDVRDYLNQFLDSETPLNFHDKRLTRHYIFDVFVNGAIAHTDKGKRAIYDQWKAVPMFSPAVENEFISIMCEVLAMIFWVRNLNKRALEEIATRST